ncbi:MAG TPA: hypothetical protein VF303_00240 [Candidatus Nanoarchaeia archaeon]
MRAVGLFVLVLIVSILLSPLVLGSKAFACHASLSVEDIIIKSNKCETIHGTFEVTNDGQSTVKNTKTLAILQAHVPPSRGGRAHFFPIAEVSLANEDIAPGEIQTRDFSISGFTVPENANSLRVEIKLIVGERGKTFISRSESFKPPACDIPQEPEKPAEPTGPKVPDSPEITVEPTPKQPGPSQVLAVAAGPDILPQTGIKGVGFQDPAPTDKNSEASTSYDVPIFIILATVSLTAGLVLIFKTPAIVEAISRFVES